MRRIKVAFTKNPFKLLTNRKTFAYDTPESIPSFFHRVLSAARYPIARSEEN